MDISHLKKQAFLNKRVDSGWNPNLYYLEYFTPSKTPSLTANLNFYHHTKLIESKNIKTESLESPGYRLIFYLLKYSKISNILKFF